MTPELGRFDADLSRMSGRRGYSGTAVTRITGTDESDSPRFPNRIPIGANSGRARLSTSTRSFSLRVPSAILGSQQQDSPKVPEELRIDSIRIEPLWDGSSDLVEVSHSCKPENWPNPVGMGPVLPQRVDPVFAIDSELDCGGRVRFENSQSRSDAARFLNEQGEVISQLESWPSSIGIGPRFDADL